MFNIFLHTPHLGEEEKEAVKKALDLGMLTSGFYIDWFEKSLRKKFKTPIVVCSSGTAALHLGLIALGIGQGDEVIVPNVSFISTINTVLYTGATPVLCDIGDPEYGLSIDPEKIIKLITPKTKAVIVVHLFGGCGDIEKLLDIVSAYKINLVEDAAQSVGCIRNGKALGTFGTVGIYSFNGNKIITSGGGGALMSSCEDIIERVRNLLNQAKSYRDPFSHREVGYNYRMSNLHAALGYIQLGKLEKFIEKKKNIYDNYKRRLNLISYKAISNYWMSVCFLRNTFPLEVFKILSENYIESRPLYVPFHHMSFLKKYVMGNFPVSEKYYKSIICLPSYLSIEEEEIKKVIDKVSALEFINE